MTTLYIDEDDIATSSVLDLVEDYLTAQEWAFERFGEEEITAVVPGAWGEIHLRYMWRDDAGLLQIAAVFDMRVVDEKRARVYEALALVNERLWLGHFEFWSEEGALMFRHALLVTDSEVYTAALTEAITHAAIKECDRFYPVFQFVLWSGKSAEEAVEAAMLETMGEA